MLLCLLLVEPPGIEENRTIIRHLVAGERGGPARAWTRRRNAVLDQTHTFFIPIRIAGKLRQRRLRIGDVGGVEPIGTSGAIKPTRDRMCCAGFGGLMHHAQTATQHPPGNSGQHRGCCLISQDHIRPCTDDMPQPTRNTEQLGGFARRERRIQKISFDIGTRRRQTAADHGRQRLDPAVFVRVQNLQHLRHSILARPRHRMRVRSCANEAELWSAASPIPVNP